MNIDHIVNHIARFAMMPPWLDEMKRFTTELEAQEGGHFDGLRGKVRERIKELKTEIAKGKQA